MGIGERHIWFLVAIFFTAQAMVGCAAAPITPRDEAGQASAVSRTHRSGTRLFESRDRSKIKIAILSHYIADYVELFADDKASRDKFVLAVELIPSFVGRKDVVFAEKKTDISFESLDRFIGSEYAENLGADAVLFVEGIKSEVRPPWQLDVVKITFVTSTGEIYKATLDTTHEYAFGIAKEIARYLDAYLSAVAKTKTVTPSQPDRQAALRMEQARLQQLRQDLNKKLKEVAAAEARLRRMEREQTRLKKMRDDLARRLAQREKGGKRFSPGEVLKDDQMAIKKAQLQQLEKKLAQQRRRLADLSQEHKAIQKQRAELERLKEELAQKEKELTGLYQERIRLHQEQKKLQSLKERLEREKLQLSQLKAKRLALQRQEKEISLAWEKIERARIEMENKRKELEKRRRWATSQGFPFKSRLFILAVGVSRYRDDRLNLRYAASDAEAFARALSSQPRSIFEEVKVKVLLDAQVTRESVIEAVVSFLGRAGSSDVAVIFIAGHGIKRQDTGTFYFLPHPANVQNLLTNGLRWSDFQETVKILRSRVKNVILVLDTCHSAALQLNSRGFRLGSDLANPFKRKGFFVLSAAQPYESAAESHRWGHGVFTYSLLEALQGKADANGDRLVDVVELFQFVERHVPELTEGRQHPHFQMGGGSLPIKALP